MTVFHAAFNKITGRVLQYSQINLTVLINFTFTLSYVTSRAKLHTIHSHFLNVNISRVYTTDFSNSCLSFYFGTILTHLFTSFNYIVCGIAMQKSLSYFYLTQLTVTAFSFSPSTSHIFLQAFSHPTSSSTPTTFAKFDMTFLAYLYLPHQPTFSWEGFWFKK